MTINRFCSSGLNAVSIAADRIRTGEADIMIAAGTESMSMIPMLGRLALNEDGVRARREHRHRLRHGAHGREGRRRSGRCRARRRTRSRSRRIRRRWRRRRRGEFDAEISPITVDEDRARSGDRHGSSRGRRSSSATRVRAPTPAPKGLAKLRPVFAAQGLGHRGQQLADVRRRGRRRSSCPSGCCGSSTLAPLARWVGFAVAGVPPEIMGVGPIAAIPKVAARRPASARSRLDWIELNEAFAAQSLAVMQRPGSRSGEGQSAGRRDRARASARRDRRDPHGDDRARHAAAQAEVRHGDDVRRHRHGRRRHFRSDVSAKLAKCNAQMRC